MLQLRRVPGFSGYFVSQNGIVVSVKRQRPRFMKPTLFNNGYRAVALYRDKAGHIKGVHRLVLSAWVGPCPDGMECCHDNGVRDDNRLSNLRWDTRKNNFKDRDLHGTTAWGERNAASRFTLEQVVAMREDATNGMTHEAIAEKYGAASRSVVTLIVSGKSWRRAPGPIKTYFKRAKLTEADVVAIRYRSAAGESRKSVALAFGVSMPTISNIVNRDTWRDVT